MPYFSQKELKPGLIMKLATALEYQKQLLLSSISPQVVLNH